MQNFIALTKLMKNMEKYRKLASNLWKFHVLKMSKNCFFYMACYLSKEIVCKKITSFTGYFLRNFFFLFFSKISNSYQKISIFSIIRRFPIMIHGIHLSYTTTIRSCPVESSPISRSKLSLNLFPIIPQSIANGFNE